MTAPSRDLQEALEWAAELRDADGWGSDGWLRIERDAVTLADEIYRLRAELADEGTLRVRLLATYESDWATLCNAMAPVVRAAVRIYRTGPVFAEGPFADAARALLSAVDTFLATGLLADIELEDSEHG